MIISQTDNTMNAVKDPQAQIADITVDFIINVLGKTDDLDIVLNRFDTLLSEYIRLEVEDGYFESAFCLMEHKGKVSRNDLFKVLFLLKEADADDSYNAMLFNYEKLREKVLVS
jgi:hypothetical protein